MKANIVIKTNESYIEFNDVDVVSVLTYVVSFDTESISKEDANELYRCGVSITFDLPKGFTHICVDKKSIEKMNFI